MASRFLDHERVATLFTQHKMKPVAIAACLGVGRGTIYRSLYRQNLAGPGPKRPNHPGGAAKAQAANDPTPEPLAEPRDPCVRCGVRGDVGCRHNTARTLGWSVGRR